MIATLALRRIQTAANGLVYLNTGTLGVAAPCVIIFRVTLYMTSGFKKITLLYFVTSLLAVSLFAQSDQIQMQTPGTGALDTFNFTGQTIPTPPKPIPYALVAGGSKGIGYAIAEALARRGYNLILIARHADSLREAKIKLESSFGVHVEVLSFDLSLDQSAIGIAEWCTTRNIPLKMLCNVAGFGGARDYLSLPLDTLRYMINLNIGSAMSLTLTLLPLLEKNAPSYILNVGSMAGFAPIPVKNLYAATKSAVVFFSYSLRYQLKEKKISVSVLCPGPVFTKPEIKKDTKEKLGWIGMQMAVPPERVGEIAVRETLNKKLVIVPGAVSKLMAFLVRALPRRLVVAIYNKAGKK